MPTEDHFNPAEDQPSSYTVDLFEQLLPHFPLTEYPKDHVLLQHSGNVGFCHLLKNGYVAVTRQSDGLVMRTVHAPSITGLGNHLQFTEGVYIKTLSTCTIGRLPTARAMELIDEHNLWKLYSQHLLSVISKLFETDIRLTAPSAYEIIRTQLLYMDSEEAEYRERTFIAQYIRERSQLSRSGIMKILSQLRKGGYIEIENGILKKVNKLPAKY